MYIFYNFSDGNNRGIKNDGLWPQYSTTKLKFMLSNFQATPIIYFHSRYKQFGSAQSGVLCGTNGSARYKSFAQHTHFQWALAIRLF
jgi:hypothetical protein